MRMMLRAILATLLIWACLCVTLNAVPTVDLQANQDGSYSIMVNNNVWFMSADTYFRGNGKVYSVAQGTLKLMSFQKQVNSSNSVGNFDEYLYVYETSDGALLFNAIIAAYYSLAIEGNVVTNPGNIRAISFTQTYVTGASNTQTDENNVLSAFPSFNTTSPKLSTTLGYMQYCGIFVGSNFGQYSGPNANLKLCDGLESGPLVIFDDGAAAILSPSVQFMSTSIAGNAGSIDFGFMGGITSLPEYTGAEAILYFDDRGVSETVMTWGDILLAQHNKVRENIYTEFTTRYIGFNTDNGAYYYYHTVPNATYEATLHQVKAYAESEDIPYRFMWLDSWWYYKDNGPNGGGVVNWTAMPSVFPSGLIDLHTTLEWPFIAHNRFWSPETTYATQNGGKYNFIIEKEYALPNDQKFWDDLLSTGAAWGVRIYEQDWLITEFENLNALKTSVSLGRTWLRQMGAAAEKNGINIQYCMPLPRHALQALEIPAVVQIRASGDYNPNTDQWKIGLSSLFDYAIGIAPFKDDFWTSTDQPGNPYHSSEPAYMLEAVVATLSSGPVTPSDGIGYTNTTVISHIVRADGLILKPDRPAISIDSTYYYRALGQNGPDGEIMHTFTRYPVGTWHIVLSADLQSTYDFTDADLNSEGKYLVLEMDAQGNFPVDFQFFDSNAPLYLDPNTKETFSLFHFAPVLSNGMIVVGEAGKFVKMSKQRVGEVSVMPGITVLMMGGAVGETITIEYFDDAISSNIRSASCTCDDGGIVIMVLVAGGDSLCSYD